MILVAYSGADQDRPYENDDETLAFTEEERAEIIACFPTDDVMTSLDGRLWRLDLLVLRNITFAANSYVTAWRLSPKRWDLDNIADDRKARLAQIDGTINTASRVNNPQLVDQLHELRGLVERESWWESLRDPRGDKHRNKFLGVVFQAWADLKGIPLDQCKISSNDTSPMLRFVRAATNPVFEITGHGIESDMIKTLFNREKKLIQNGE